MSTCPVTFINCHINLNIDNYKIKSISYDKEKNKDKCYKKISDNEFKLFYIFNGNNDIIQSLNIENYTISENCIEVKGFNIIIKREDPTQNNTVFEINLKNTYTFNNNEILISGTSDRKIFLNETSFLRTKDGKINLTLDQLKQVCENIQEAVDIFLCQIFPLNLNLIKEFICLLIDDTAIVDDPIKLLKTYISKIDSPKFYNLKIADIETIKYSYYLHNNNYYLIIVEKTNNPENLDNSTNTLFITKDGFKTIESNDSRKYSFIIHVMIDLDKRDQQIAKSMITQIIENNNELFKNIINQKCDSIELLPYPSKNFGAFAYFGMTIGAYKYIDSLMYHIKDQDTRAIMYRSYNGTYSADNSNNSNNSIPFSFYLNRMTQYLLLIPGAILLPIFYSVSYIGLTNWINK